jgi:hypothetical protein
MDFLKYNESITPRHKEIYRTVKPSIRALSLTVADQSGWPLLSRELSPAQTTG